MLESTWQTPSGLEKIMADRMLTVPKIADITGLNVSTISALLKNIRLMDDDKPFPQYRVVKKVADSFGLMPLLFYDSDERPVTLGSNAPWTIDNYVGKVFIEKRDKRSKEEISNGASVYVSNYKNAENGNVISLKNLKQIASFYELKIKLLVEIPGQKQKYLQVSTATTLKERIVEIMDQRYFSIASISKKTGVNQIAIIKIKNKGHLPNYSSLQKIADSLDLVPIVLYKSDGALETLGFTCPISEIDNYLGQVFRAYRGPVAQDTINSRSGVTAEVIKKIEEGSVHFNLKSVERLASYYRLTVRYLAEK